MTWRSPHSPLECKQPVTDRMDIRIDTGFHYRNPNVYIPPSYVNNPNNEYTPKYNVEIASEEQIKEHLAQPRNWVPQRHETLPEIPSDTAFICSPADVSGHRKVHLQHKDISGNICRGLKSYVMNMDRYFPNIMRTLAE